MSAPISRLRLTGILEGISFLLLLGVAVPLERVAHRPMAVHILGPIHGVLFLAFCLALALVMRRHRWPLSRSALVFASSLVPFGTFLMDRHVRAWGAVSE